jgi:hypothetical protein
MSSISEFAFTDFADKPALVNEIVELEKRLQQETGQQVTLIAFSPTDAPPQQTADLN